MMMESRRVIELRAAIKRLFTLKGHGFSRAVRAPNRNAALAAEGMRFVAGEFPQGLKPMSVLQLLAARLKPCPFKADQVWARISFSATRLLFAIALLLATGMATLAQNAPSTASRPAHSAATTDYSISGTVVNAASGEPVRRAEVSVLSEADFHAVASVETDNEGRFAVQGLAAGKYPLSVSKRGFLTSFYDEHDGGFNTAIVTGADQDTSQIVFRLTPGASLHGVVTGDGGDPVEGASVMLFLKPHGNNPGARITKTDEATTDDTGAYEFDGLAPGEYLVAVKAEPWYALHRFAAEARQGLADDPVAALDVAYPVTFFDSTTDEPSATHIVLAKGGSEEANINLRAVPALHLTVDTPRREDGRLARPLLRQFIFGTQISGETAGFMDGSGTGTKSNGFQDATRTGTLEFNSLAPGHYLLAQGDPPRIANLDATTSLQIDPSLGTPTVTVSGILQASNGAVLPENLRVSLNSLDGVQGQFPPDVPCIRGSFSFATVLPGTWELTAESPGKMLSITSISLGSRTHAGNLLTVKDKPIQVVATMSLSETRVEGFARKEGKGKAGVMVVLVPKDPAAFRALTRTDQSDSDGSFSLRDVPPGQYTVVAIEDGWEMDRSRPEAYQRYISQGIAVTVTETSGKLVRLSQGVPVQSR
jgi:hypothetical protein